MNCARDKDVGGDKGSSFVIDRFDEWVDTLSAEAFTAVKNALWTSYLARREPLPLGKKPPDPPSPPDESSE